MAVQGTNITDTLDQLFADDEVVQWYPKQSKCFKKVQSASAKSINAKGGLYLIETEIPQALSASDFASSDGAEFPVGGRLAFLVLTVSPVTHRASFEVSSNVEVQDEAKYKQRPAKGYQYVMRCIKALMSAYGLKQSRDLWGDKVGELARSSAAAVSNTVTCNTSANLFGSFLIQVGMRLEFRDGSGTIVAYGTVTTVNRQAKTFVCNDVRDNTDTVTGTLQANGVTTNTRVYMRGCYNQNWSGISHMLETSGAFQGAADRTGHYRLPGIKEDKGGATLTVGMVRKMISDQEMRVDGDEVKGEFFASTQYDAFEATGIATKVYGQNGGKLTQGYGQIAMQSADGARNFNKDLFIPRDVLALVDIDKLDKFEMHTFKPLKDNGGSYFHQANGVNAHKDSKFVYFRGIGNLGTDDPSQLGVWYYNLSTAGLSTGNI